MEDRLMSKGSALIIGLNSVDPKHYFGWSGDLNACEADADDMAEIAKSKGFKVTSLLTKEANRDNVIRILEENIQSLQAGDIFMISYSGHGGQVPDKNGDEVDVVGSSSDIEDETWCLYDGQLIDDEINSYLGKFRKGVRIIVFSDSCHSGTVTKVANFRNTLNLINSNVDNQNNKYKFMPGSIALRTYRSNREFYDKILNKIEKKEAKGDSVKASVILISGCQDNQLSLDGTFNGQFTGQLLTIWQNGLFNENYRQFHRKILLSMPPTQTPNYFRIGQINSKFENQIPFTI